MTELSNSIASRVAARISALSLSQREVARRAAIPESTLRNLLNGTTEHPRADTLQALAAALDTTVENLAGTAPLPSHRASEVRVADGIPVPASGLLPKDVPVLGTVAGSPLGKGAFQLTPDIVDYVRRPAGLAGATDAFALFVEGDSMSPEFEPGDLVFVHPHKKPRTGDYVVIEEPDSDNGSPRGFIKRLISRTDAHVRTEQFNPRAEITFVMRPGLRVLKVILDGELYGV